MGFKKGKGGDGASVLIWDKKSIETMKGKYGLELSSETSVSSESPVPDNTKLAEDTEVPELSGSSKFISENNNLFGD